ncbi:MAG: flavodoxin family protein [Verrucomicrobiota bacterium]
MKLLILQGSPRANGNSSLLAGAAAEGAKEAGYEVTCVQIADILQGFLRDCRTCRKEDGECSIEDQFRNVFFEQYLTADGVVFSTPLYWYGVSGQVKTFLDRTFCYYAASYPQSDTVVSGMCGKRIGLLISSEETFPTAPAGVIHQMQEFSRYTRSHFVGVVQGIGNKRGDVLRDPCRPCERARDLGRTFFSQHLSDYQIDTPRPGSVWAESP